MKRGRAWRPTLPAADGENACGDEATARSALPRQGDVLVGPGLQEATVSVRPRRGPSRARLGLVVRLVLFAPHVIIFPRLALLLREFDVAPTWNATGVASARRETRRPATPPRRRESL